jgi:hypothetical protein
MNIKSKIEKTVEGGGSYLLREQYASTLTAVGVACTLVYDHENVTVVPIL